MKKLLIFLLLLPSSAYAADCQWYLRNNIKNKSQALEKCGTPDFKTQTGTTGVVSGGVYVGTDQEDWVYNNSDGSMTVISFSGNKRVRFDQKQR